MVDLKALRKKQGMTAVELGAKAKISPSALSMISTGRRRPSVDSAKRLAAALGIDWTLFFENDGAYIRDGGQAVVGNGGQSVVNFRPISGETSMNLPEKPMFFEDDALPETRSPSG